MKKDGVPYVPMHQGERLRELISESDRYKNSVTDFAVELFGGDPVKNLRQKVYYLYDKSDLKVSELIGCCHALGITVEDFLGSEYGSILTNRVSQVEIHDNKAIKARLEVLEHAVSKLIAECKYSSG